MKRIRIFHILLSLAAFFIVASCDNFMDTHKEFIKDGELIYAPKADSVIFFAGRGRILFRCWLDNSPNVRSIDMFYNNGKDSIIIPVSPTSGLDSIDYMIPNLEEKSYTFNIRTTDIFDHKSLSITSFGTSYGAMYEATLVNRRVNGASLVEQNGTTGVVTFFSAAPLQVSSQVRYTKSDGSTAIVSMPSSLSAINLPNAKPGTPFATRSLYIPEATAIDTFATAWVTQNASFPNDYSYDRSAWRASCSTVNGGDFDPRIFFDGNNDTFWQTWSYGLPQWVTVDFGKALNATRFELYARPDWAWSDTKSYEIYLGNSRNANDATAWTKIAQTLNYATKVEVVSDNTTLKGRYLKIVFPDSNRGDCISLAELYVYGVNDGLPALRDVAYKKPVTVSDFEPGYPGQNAVDGIRTGDGNRWRSVVGNFNEHWIEIDLQGFFTISEYVLWRHFNTPTQLMPKFSLQAWVAGAWADVSSEDNNTTDTEYYRVFSPVTTNKVRWYVPPYVNNAVRVFEIEVLGIPAGN